MSDPTSLDSWLPAYSVREHHQRTIEASPEETLAATLRLPVAPDGIVRTLFRLRGLGSGRQTIAQFADSGGFVLLEQTPTTLVFGLAGRIHDGRRLAANRQEWIDRTSAALFRLYWLVVGPFSAWIRRRWLLAAARAVPRMTRR